MPDEDDKKLQDLESRIEAARAEYEEDYNPKPKPKFQGGNDTAGYEFLASVFSGGLIGYLIDHFAGTLPWGMLIFLILGFWAGVMRANRRMKSNTKNDTQKDKKN